jgi:hypothetical protein
MLLRWNRTVQLLPVGCVSWAGPWLQCRPAVSGQAHQWRPPV